jgi:hypothetical protein
MISQIENVLKNFQGQPEKKETLVVLSRKLSIMLQLLKTGPGGAKHPLKLETLEAAEQQIQHWMIQIQGKAKQAVGAPPATGQPPPAAPTPMAPPMQQPIAAPQPSVPVQPVSLMQPAPVAPALMPPLQSVPAPMAPMVPHNTPSLPAKLPDRKPDGKPELIMNGAPPQPSLPPSMMPAATPVPNTLAGATVSPPLIPTPPNTNSTNHAFITFMDKINLLDKDKDLLRVVSTEVNRIYEPLWRGSASKFVKKRTAMEDNSGAVSTSSFWWAADNKSTNGNHAVNTMNGAANLGEPGAPIVLDADYGQPNLLKRTKTMEYHNGVMIGGVYEAISGH